MSRVIRVVKEFLKSIQVPLPELESVCTTLNVRCGNQDEIDSFVREIVENLGKYDEKIVQRDESVILSGAELLPGLSLAEYWSELSMKTQDAIWKYVNLILLAGAKHVRHLDRTVSNTVSKTDEISISDKLKDPEIREKMMETIRKTIETIPETTESGKDTEEVIKDFMSGLDGTNIGDLVKDIAGDLSGEFSPENLGLPEGADLDSLGTDDLMGILGNPKIAAKLFGIVSKIGDKINGKINGGGIDKEQLLRESQELLAKSGGLLKKMNPQVAEMLRGMGVNPDDLANLSSRKVRRNMERKVKKQKGKVIRKKKTTKGKVKSKPTTE